MRRELSVITGVGLFLLSIPAWAQTTACNLATGSGTPTQSDVNAAINIYYIRKWRICARVEEDFVSCDGYNSLFQTVLLLTFKKRQDIRFGQRIVI